MKTKISETSKKCFPREWIKQIEKSGKFFEQEIATMVCNSSFGFVIPNYAFADVEKEISREMDIFAIAGHKIGRKWNFFFPILLISVSKSPIVCFTREDQVNPYTTAQIQYSGMPRKVYIKGEEVDILDYLQLEEFHHYYKSKTISSQFWTPKEKRESQGDYFYNELVLPLVKAVVAEKKEHEKEWVFDPAGEPINLQFYYPVIVVDQLWGCTFIEGKPSYTETDSIPFIFHTVSKGFAGDYLIDICTKRGLQDKLSEISKEADRIVEIIGKNRKLLEDSALKDAKARNEIKNDLPF